MFDSLKACDIVKRYGGTLALDRVSFGVRPGAVNVLIGENGAGKSTLMRILAGVEQPTSGSLEMDGRPVRFASVTDASDRGVGIIHQELNLCANLSVADNIFLRRPVKGGSIALNRRAEREAARELLLRLEEDIHPDTRVGELRLGQQQIVEIAKALGERCEVLIMDEPTSALSAAEIGALFRVIGELRRSGVGIVYISHKLEELLEIGDTIAVLRDGRMVGEGQACDVDVDWIVERMLGETDRLVRTAPRRRLGRPVLELKGLSVRRMSSGGRVTDVSATFDAGTVTAIYGLLGSGRTELLEAVCGARAFEGSLRFEGVAFKRQGVGKRVAAGVCMAPEDRQRDGLFQNLSVGENLTLASLRKMSHFGVVSKTRERSMIAEMTRRLSIKARTPRSPIGALSGGNQQKVVIGRALLAQPKVLLLDEPSRGVDVQARAEIFAMIEHLADEGLAVVFSTSDLAEARTMADRIIVMSDGRVTLDAAASDLADGALIRAANASKTPGAAEVSAP